MTREEELIKYLWWAAQIFRRQADLGFTQGHKIKEWRDAVLPVLKRIEEEKRSE